MNPSDLLHAARDIAGYLALGAGLFFVIVGAIGVLRFPDFYTRLHAAGVTDTLGAELMLLGLMLQADSIQSAAKLALIGLFLFITSPTSTHALANAAFTAGLEPLLGRRGAQGAPGGGPGADAA
jgi:multicomponent Na+:H+ antiporter subunit G